MNTRIAVRLLRAVTRAPARRGFAHTFLGRTILTVTSVVALWLSLSPSAWAVPSYTRRYAVECSRCHTSWGALNRSGVTFRLSGYRSLDGVTLKPETDDIELSHGMLTLPGTLPLSVIAGAGVDYRKETRTDSNGTTSVRTGSTIAVEDASIFLTAPFGDHLSAFIEFPMFETRAWEFTPTGAAEANDIGGPSQIQFATETPAFEVAKFFWNNLIGSDNSVNLLGGITHPPLAYSPGKVRLSVNQYLIYERRALDLISPHKVDDVLGGSADYLFRLSEPQGLFEVNGMVVPGKQVTDVSKKETFWFEYHAGVSNGSNNAADNNNDKDFYGRFVMRWFGQSLGIFAYDSANTYDDTLRTDASIAANPTNGIMSGNQVPNGMSRIGPDFTLSLAPFGVPMWLDNQLMYNREDSPTGFNVPFTWRGGFSQLNWQLSKETMLYARYDWITGDRFDDSTLGGITVSEPKESDEVLGFGYLIRQNVKLIGEYRHHRFVDMAVGTPVNSGPVTPEIVDDGFTLRVMVGL